MPLERPSLDIVIVNWNSGRDLRACLQALSGTDRRDLELSNVVVVDNASTDESLAALEGCGLQVFVIRNSSNRGFAAACNQGAAHSGAKYLLFLNPDTTLMPRSLAAPISFLERHGSGVGICGIQLLDEHGCICRTCVRFSTPMRVLAMIFGLQHAFPRAFPRQLMLEWDHKDTREVDQVMGAFFLVRRTLFRELCGFDERFFVFYEEHDFAYRASLIGRKTYFLASVAAVHKGQGSVGKAIGPSMFYLLRSRVLYGYKHFGVVWGTLLLLATLLIEPLTRALLSAATNSLARPRDIVKAYLCLWQNLFRLNAHTEIEN